MTKTELVALTSGRLPLGVQPADDESLESYLDRLAYRYHATRGAMLRATGLSPETGPARLPTGFPIALDDARLDAFTARTGLSADAVARMQLIHYHPTVLRVRDDDGVVCGSRELGLDEWVHVYGANACPACLSEREGAWRLAWKLPWSFACAQHGTLLIDRCPACTARLIFGRPEKSSSPFSTQLVVPGSCSSRPSNERSQEPCGHDLASVQSCTATRRVLAAQEHLNGAIAGEHLAVLGAPVGSREYLRHARALVALTLRFGMPEDLGELPAAAVAAFESYACAREQTLEIASQRRQGVRPGPRMRSYTANPRQPAVMAAVAPAVVEALAASSRREAGRLLDWLVARLRDAGLPPNVGTRYGLTDEITAALAVQARPGIALWSTEASNGARRSRRGGEAEERMLFGQVRVEHLPHVLWREAYEPLFRELLPSKQQLTVRMFLSMLAAKTLLQGTWVHAAQRLDMDCIDARGCSNGFTTRIVREESGDAIRGATQLLLRLLDERPTLVNYAQRRARFAALTEIEDEAWRAIADAAGIHPGLGARRRNAAVWVWSELTGGPYFRAPAAAGTAHHPSEMTRGRGRKDDCFWTVFNGFYRQQLPHLRPHLTAYAQGLLGSEPLRPFAASDVTRALTAERSRHPLRQSEH